MTTALTSVVLLLAASHGDSGHMDWGNGWWIVMLLFWVAVIAGVVWLMVWRARGGTRGVGASTHDQTGALDLLDRRLAEGQISVEEYEERRRVLSSGTGTAS